MARAVNWVLGSVAQMAAALGKSARTVRRLAAEGLIPGAVRGPRGWILPMTTRQYATGAGVSERTARRRAVARATTPTAPEVQSAVPVRVPAGRGPVPTVKGKRMINPRIWPYQYQGFAWLRFVASGDIIKWFSSTIPSRVAMTWRQIESAVRAEVSVVFGNSPVRIMQVGLVYAHHA